MLASYFTAVNSRNAPIINRRRRPVSVSVGGKWCACLTMDQAQRTGGRNGLGMSPTFSDPTPIVGIAIDYLTDATGCVG